MPEQPAVLTVKDVAARLGVHAETIRRWERRGVIAPAMRRRRMRVYGEEDLARIKQAVMHEGVSPNRKEVRHGDDEHGPKTGV